MITYTISNWNDLYENADTRKRKKLFWVLVPNGHDGLGYCSIMERDDALEIFGAWVLILQVASRSSIRGKLISSKGQPYSAKQIAIITRSPASSIAAALEVLVDIGWVSADDPDKAADDPDKVADVGMSVSVKKERKRDGKISPLTPQRGGESVEGDGADAPPLLTEVLPAEFLADEAFMDTWESWDKYQTKTNRRKWIPERIKCQLEDLGRMNLDDARASLRQSLKIGLGAPLEVNHHKQKTTGASTDLKPARVKVDTETADGVIEAMKKANG